MDDTFYLLQLKFFKSLLETIILYAVVATPVCLVNGIFFNFSFKSIVNLFISKHGILNFIF